MHSLCLLGVCSSDKNKCLRKKKEGACEWGEGGVFCSVLLAFESLHITTAVNMPLRRTQEELRAFSRAFVHFVSIAPRAHGAPRQDWTDFI